MIINVKLSRSQTPHFNDSFYIVFGFAFYCLNLPSSTRFYMWLGKQASRHLHEPHGKTNAVLSFPMSPISAIVCSGLAEGMGLNCFAYK